MTVTPANIVANEAMIAMDKVERLAREQGSGNNLEFFKIIASPFGEFQVLLKLTGIDRGIHIKSPTS